MNNIKLLMKEVPREMKGDEKDKVRDSTRRKVVMEKRRARRMQARRGVRREREAIISVKYSKIIPYAVKEKESISCYL